MGGNFFLIFTTAAYGVLRAEGNVKKTTYAMSFGAIVNMILDPLFIYTLGLGISGAAYATVLSMALVTLIMIYWFRRDTYIKFSYKCFKLSKVIMRKLLLVGLPAGVEFLILAIVAGALNLLLMMISGVDGVAIYSAGWRVVMFAILPIVSVGLSVVSVIGASYGGRRFENFKIVQNYAIKVGLLIAVIISILTYVFAPQITLIFTYSSQTADLSGEIANFLRFMCFFYIFVPVGSVAASIFQGVGRGIDSLVLTFIRELLLIVLFAYIFTMFFGLGINGVWLGIVVGNVVGSLISYLWSLIFVNALLKSKKEEYDETFS
ncbi:MAG: polysaccharide biosynthesis C-terminal domain-containing protein, partial [Methanobrevibacter sp.]|jgi:putative MATE family efflux protein|nr:polysaccharide biosynthesis C-terminal domain-containing protein [Methanobrevibacter sp.]